MGSGLNAQDKRIWELHMQGFSPSAIASIVGACDYAVRAVIVGAWHDDKLAAREAKRKSAA